MTFNNFGLHPQILKAISAAGYTEPTEIQLKAISKIMRGFDLRASAQTGTGKTGAFLLPILDRLARPAPQAGKGPRALILVPTRELAMQVATQTEKYSKYLHQIKTVCVFGGVPYAKQMHQLSKPYDVLIATPGRLIDLIHRSKIHFSRLEILVLDEADRMLDMGFVKPVEQIVALTPPSRQTLLFSATLQGSIRDLSEKLLNKPMDIVVHVEPTKPTNIDQSLYYVDDIHHKYLLLDHLLSNDHCTIVFTSTKRHADQLVAKLLDKGLEAAALHGDMNQRHRTRTITQLRNGKIRVLVATDVASRGIDVQSISHIVNFDLPRSAEDYVHRIGRTGRAGAKGIASSFAARGDAPLVRKIEGFTGKKIALAEIAGLEPRKKQQPTKPHLRNSKRPFRAKKKTSFEIRFGQKNR